MDSQREEKDKEKREERKRGRKFNIGGRILSKDELKNSKWKQNYEFYEK